MNKIRTTYSHENAIVTISLDDGKGNILDHTMMDELQYIFDSFTKKEELKCIVIEGAGKHFSFGASVEEHKKEYAATMLKIFHQLFYSIINLSIPALAKVSGQCLGGGMELALMCNFIFADKTARFGQPESVLGVFPPPASILLPEKIGYARAEELLITGKTITAEEAGSMGLVNAAFEDKEQLDAGVNDWIEKNILPKSASSLRYSVKAARMKLNHVISSFLPQLESMYVNQLMQTHDANEGIQSFLEKRKPVWMNN